MTRLQKKCLIAAAATHLLVVVVLLCSGFITSKPKADNTQVLDMIPPTVLENVLNSGVQGAQPPPPTPKPPEPTPPTPVPTPEPPKPVVVPRPEPKPEPVKPVEDEKPVEKPDFEKPKPKPVKHDIKPDLTVVKRDPKKVADDAAAAAEAAKAEKAAREAKRKAAEAFKSAVRNISDKASSATDVELPHGDSSAAAANYASVVRSIYEHAWIAPDNADNDDAIVKVSVTIARDGRVISSSIQNRSGDSKVDNSIQRTLDRVNFVREFPDGMRGSEKTFIINFNLKAKRMLL